MTAQRKRISSQESMISELTKIEIEKKTATNRRRLRYLLDKEKEIECTLNLGRFRNHPSCEILNSFARGRGLNGLFVIEDKGTIPIFVNDETLMICPDALKIADRLLLSADSGLWKEGFDYLIDFFKYLERAQGQTRIKGVEPVSIAHQKAWAIRDGFETQVESAARAFLILEYFGTGSVTEEGVQKPLSGMEDDCAKKVFERIKKISTG